MPLRIVLFVLSLLLASPSQALSGSDAFICDLIEYSEDPEEVFQATMEAHDRGICGFTKRVEANPTPETTTHSQPRVDREEAERRIFVGGAVICILKGRCSQAQVTHH